MLPSYKRQITLILRPTLTSHTYEPRVGVQFVPFTCESQTSLQAREVGKRYGSERLREWFVHFGTQQPAQFYTTTQQANMHVLGTLPPHEAERTGDRRKGVRRWGQEGSPPPPTPPELTAT